MSNNTNQVDPTTWLERLTQDDSSAGLDSIHQEVVDLFKIPNADVLNDVARANMMKQSRRSTLPHSSFNPPLTER